MQNKSPILYEGVYSNHFTDCRDCIDIYVFFKHFQMKINIPETIDTNTAGKYVLTVYVHPEKFSFSIHCPDKPESYFFYKINPTGQSDAFSVFKDLFFDNDFFAYPFQKTCILVFSPLFTFVPDAIYSDKYKAGFVNFIFSEQEGKILDCPVSPAKLQILYSLSEDVHGFFTRSFNEPEFIHHSAPLIAYFLSPHVKHKKRQMTVNVHEKGIDVLCFSRKTFLLGNHFPCENHRDAVYYILYTWKQLKMDPLTDRLHITGELSQNEDLNKNLQLHIQHVHPVLPSGKKQFKIINADIPFELAVFFLCEL